MFNRFSNKNLKNWFDFIFVIEKIWISVENLSSFNFSLWIRDENCIGGSINIVVWLQFKFVDHILVITELFPHIGALHLNHLHVVLIFLHLLVSHFFLLSSHSHFFLSLLHVGLFHLLLFNKSRVWLHIDRDDESCKSITSYNTAIIHDVLRGNLTIKHLNIRFVYLHIFPVRVSISLLLDNLGFGSEAVTADHALIHLLLLLHLHSVELAWVLLLHHLHRVLNHLAHHLLRGHLLLHLHLHAASLVIIVHSVHI